MYDKVCQLGELGFKGLKQKCSKVGLGLKLLEIYFLFAGKFIRLQCSSNLSMLTQPCDVHFTVFNFAVHFIFE